MADRSPRSTRGSQLLGLAGASEPLLPVSEPDSPSASSEGGCSPRGRPSACATALARLHATAAALEVWLVPDLDAFTAERLVFFKSDVQRWREEAARLPKGDPKRADLLRDCAFSEWFQPRHPRRLFARRAPAP